MDMPAAEVIQKAAEQGMQLTAQNVHSTRSELRKREKLGVGAPGRPGRKPGSGASKSSSSSASSGFSGSGGSSGSSGSSGGDSGRGRGDDSDARQFVRLVGAIGLRRAEVLMSEMKDLFSSVQLS